MAWSVVQSAIATSGATAVNSQAATFGSNVSAGNKLICWATSSCGAAGSPLASVKDGAGNNFTQVATIGATPNGPIVGAVWALDVPSGDVGTKPTITATLGSSQQGSLAVWIAEVSGLLSGGTGADGTAAITTFTTAATNGSGSYSSTAANEFLLACWGDNGGPETTSGPSGYILDGNSQNTSSDNNCLVAYKNSSNGTETATWSNSGTFCGGVNVLVAFKLASTTATVQTTAAQQYAPGWHPGAGLPGMPGGIPFLAVPGLNGPPAAPAGGGPPLAPLSHPVQAKVFPARGGHISRQAGVYGQAGPPVYPANRPVKAQPSVPWLAGRARGRAGIYQGTGPPVRPFQQPVAAASRGLPARGRTRFLPGLFGGTGPSVAPLRSPVTIRRVLPPGGRVSRRAGTYSGLGPPVIPQRSPVRAKWFPGRGGWTRHSSGTFVSVVPQTGPPVYPFTRPVQARRFAARGGTTLRPATGVYGGLGPPVTPPSQPVTAKVRMLPFRGRTGRIAGFFGGTGPPIRPQRIPVRAVPPLPPRGRAWGIAGLFGGTGSPVRQQRSPVEAWWRRLLFLPGRRYISTTQPPPVVVLTQPPPADWDASPAPPRWLAEPGEQRWLAGLVPGRWDAEITAGRWTAVACSGRWGAALADFEPISALSDENVNISWTSELDGTRIDPTVQPMPVSAAFPASSGNTSAPAQPATWYTGAWLTGGAQGGRFVSQHLVGPGTSGPVLASGSKYDVWGKIVTGTETVVKFAGTLTVI